MVKLVYVIRAREGVAPEEFYRYWREEHAPKVRAVAEVIRARRYVQSHTIDTPLNAALIASRGMSPLYESLSAVTEKLFDAVVNLNLKGPFRLSTLVGERMVADGGGSIINVSSSGSRRPRPEQLPYSAAKAGLNALTEGLALAFGPTVRVNTLMPGPFLTDISKAWDIPATTKGAQHFALQRLGNPPEIIGAALYLASDASSYTSGSIIRVDGGIP